MNPAPPANIKLSVVVVVVSLCIWIATNLTLTAHEASGPDRASDSFSCSVFAPTLRALSAASPARLPSARNAHLSLAGFEATRYGAESTAVLRYLAGVTHEFDATLLTQALHLHASPSTPLMPCRLSVPVSPGCHASLRLSRRSPRAAISDRSHDALRCPCLRVWSPGPRSCCLSESGRASISLVAGIAPPRSDLRRTLTAHVNQPLRRAPTRIALSPSGLRAGLATAREGNPGRAPR